VSTNVLSAIPYVLEQQQVEIGYDGPQTAPALVPGFKERTRMATQNMPTKALGLIGLVVFLAAVALGLAATGWESPDLIKFIGFLTVALFTIGTKLAIPGPAGNLPLTFVFVLMGMLDLSSSETVVLAAVVAIGQCYWHSSEKPHALQVSFNAATMVLAASAAAALCDSSASAASAIPPLIRFAMATVLFCVLHTAPVAAAVAFSEDLPFFATWRDCYLWTTPYYLAGGVAALLFSAASRLVGWQTVLLSGPLIYLVYRAYRLHVLRLQNQKKHAEDVSALHLRTIQALALAIEAKDHTTHDHLARVQVYARELARELKLSPSDQEALLAASVLHDIGKLAVPEHIISKPGRLSPEEFEKMKIHPLVGAEILEEVKFPYPVVPIVRAHHEKWDGTGYPYGLAGEEIPVGARILSAVDCLDALASDRQYRRAMPLDKAIEIVKSESGKSFDPVVVDVLVRRCVELEKMAVGAGVDKIKLSMDVKIERGHAPATGFAESAEPEVVSGPQTSMDPLASIAAATQEAQMLYELTQDLGNSLSLQEALAFVGVRLKRLIPYDTIAIYIRREEKLHPEYVSGENLRLFTSLEIPIGQGLSGWVAENVKPILNGNPSVEAGYLNDPTKYSTLRSALAVPLNGVTGLLGVLALYRADRDAFSKENLRILIAISPKVALAIENALTHRRLETSITTDYLTNLPNARSLFLSLDNEVARAQRTRSSLAVVVCDLDGFKIVNDRFGHLTGNKVLRSIAAGLREVCGPTDYLARMGGDEFVILRPGDDVDELERRIEDMRTAVRRAGEAAPEPIALGMSVGVATYPEDGADAEELLAESDRRMYKNKRLRKKERGAVIPMDVAAAS
jgi:diguanylate cyclase (GGDEF)-like protein/putative nucleotidyltransferase with HDIG domain